MDSFTRGLLLALVVLALVAVSGPAMMGGMMGPAGMSLGGAMLEAGIAACSGASAA